MHIMKTEHVLASVVAAAVGGTVLAGGGIYVMQMSAADEAQNKARLESYPAQ
jgi:hypothetical protein